MQEERPTPSNNCPPSGAVFGLCRGTITLSRGIKLGLGLLCVPGETFHRRRHRLRKEKQVISAPLVCIFGSACSCRGHSSRARWTVPFEMPAYVVPITFFLFLLKGCASSLTRCSVDGVSRESRIGGSGTGVSLARCRSWPPRGATE